MKRAGFSLFITMATLAGMIVVVMVGAASVDSAVLATRNRMESRKAQLAAEAGVHRAIAELALAATNVKLTTDSWYTLGTTGADNFKLADNSFRIQIVDACARINLNTAPEAQLALLPLTQEQVDALLDWRSAGETPRSDGAKDAYYNGLSNPYNAHLGPLTSFDELLQVRYFTPATLYTVQNVGTNLTTSTDGSALPTLYDLCTVDSSSQAMNTSGTALPDINTATAQQLTRGGISQQNAQRLTTGAGRPYTTWAAVLRALAGGSALADANRLLRTYTIGTTPKAGTINVNTAPATVLNSLPGFTDAISQQIVSQQSTGLNTLGDLTSIPGITLNVLTQIADLVSVNSSRFIVRSVGKSGSTTFTIEAIVDTSGTTPRIIREDHPPFNDMTTRWSWDDPNNDISLGTQS